MPEVSIVVPAYNPGRYLAHTLESLFAQSLEHWECVVVDDGSSENLEWVTARDPRIRLVRQPNQGLSAARNLGIGVSTAPLVAFCDADDIWYPSKLEAQVALMNSNPDAPACSTDFEVIDGDGTVIRRGYGDGTSNYRELLHGCGLCVSTMMVRRDALDRWGAFDLRYRQAQDWDLWLRLARNATFARVNQVLVGYRVHGANMSADYRRLLEEGTAILGKHLTGDWAGDAEVGIRRLHGLAGYQAYDVFRATRDIRSLVDALRWAPGYTIRSLSRFAQSHALAGLTTALRVERRR